MMKTYRFWLLSALILSICSTLAFAQPTTDVYGQVRIYNGTCDSGVGMNGVTVLLYDAAHTVEYSTTTYTDAAFMVEHNLTSPLGIYYFDNVPYRTDYFVEVIPPAGVTLATDPGQGSWWNANPREVGTNFYRCFLMVLGSSTGTPHTIGFWKHQATVAVTGKGSAQIPAAQLMLLYQELYDHFDGANDFPIQGVSSVNGAPLTAQAAINTFNLSNGGSAGMINKAKKQLLALCLNVVGGYKASWDTISADHRTVSEAISFAADKITNGGSGLETAKNACDKINNGLLVPAGWIPAGYGIIYYGIPDESFSLNPELPSAIQLAGNYPNPFNPETTIRFSLPEAAQVSLTVYNASGSKIAELVNGWREAGAQEVTFHAAQLPSGVYLYRLEASGYSLTGKMALLK